MAMKYTQTILADTASALPTVADIGQPGFAQDTKLLYSYSGSGWGLGSAPGSSTKTFAQSPYTVVATDQNVYADTTGGVVVFNLPDALTVQNMVCRFKNIGSVTSNLLRLIPFTGQTVDGSPTRSAMINDGFTLQAIGTDWKVLTSYYPSTERAVYGQTTVKAGDTLQASAVAANTFQYFASQYTLPANSMVQGLELVYEGNGRFNSTGLGPSTIAQVMAGSAEMINTGALNVVAGVTDYAYYFKIILKVTAAGSSGTIRPFGKLDFQNAASGQTVGFAFTPADKTFNTTIDNVLKLGAAWTSQTAGNSNTLRDLQIYEIRPPKAAN